MNEDTGAVDEVLDNITVQFVTMLRQPVLRREAVVADGEEKPKRPRAYVRTKDVLDVRQERLVRIEGSRAVVSWGGAYGPLVEVARFSLNTGRLVGNADWLLDADSLKALRKLARKMKTPADPAASPNDVEEAERSPMEIADEDAAKQAEG